MRRSLYIIPAIAILALASACDDGDDGAPATSTSAPATEAASPLVETATPDAEPSPSEDAAIRIDQPELGAVVSVPFEISGSANVFEAALSLQVLTDSGDLLCQHNIMATSGSGTPGTWSTVMAFPPPEPSSGATASPIVVRALSYSAQDGSEENVVTLNINVSGERPGNVIETPACSAEAPLDAPLAVSGVTDAFEGAMQLELQDASGAVVLTQPVQAAGGLGDAPWTTTIDLAAVTLQPGQYTLIAFDVSAENGSRQNEFPVPIQLVAP